MKGAARKREPRRELSLAYVETLDEYLAGGGEAALRRGYEIGRQAMAEGLGVLEMALMHHDALSAALRKGRPGRAEQDLRRAKEFAAESLSSFEMAHRGFRDAMSALRRLNETLEKEIQRIAHAVHDEAGQLLFAARLAMSAVAHDLRPALRERMEEIGGILDRAEKELRRLSHELRPTILDDLGLEPALRLLADGTLRSAKLSIRVESFLEERLPPNLEATVYRVVQEAIANVTRHSEARNVSIRLARDDREALRCVVKDDGKGFDTGILARAERKGLGLVGIRQRLDAVGGALEIRSQPGSGTELIVTIPMER